MKWFERGTSGNPPPDKAVVGEPAPLKTTGYEERLKRGEYLGILETYAVSWDMEKAGRDVWQNFFDAAGGTVDGVRFAIYEQGEDGNKQYIVRVEGDADYDYRKLLHIGGTSKGDSATAGGFGEGSKILSLILLRDQGFTDVQFGSKDWIIDFSLQQVPEGTYDQEVRGLTARLTNTEERSGNYILLTTQELEKAQAIINARELFYSEDNPDFQNPTIDKRPENGGIGGFKFLGLDKNNRLNNGHLYDAGQRRHYQVDNKWDTVEGVNIWTWNKVFGKDRDRGTVSRQSLEKEVIEPLIASLSSEEIIHSLEEMGPVWETGKASFYEMAYKIMEHGVKKLAAENVRLEFPETHLSCNSFLPLYISDALKEQGYTICHNFFEKIGMKGALEKFHEMQEHLRTEPSPEQQQRIELLQQAVQLLKDVFQQGKIKKLIENKDIWIFSRGNENSIINGQYNESYVWLSEELLNEQFPQAMATYLHEIDHKSGNDQSAEFSYALTDTLRDVISAMLSNPEIFSQFLQLQESWNSVEPRKRSEL